MSPSSSRESGSQPRNGAAKGRKSPGRAPSVRGRAASASTRPAGSPAGRDGGRTASPKGKSRHRRKASKSPKNARPAVPELQRIGSARTGSLAKKIVGSTEKRLWGSAEASASQQLEMEYLRKLAAEPIGVVPEDSSGSNISDIFGQDSVDSQHLAAAAASCHTDQEQTALLSEDSMDQKPNVTNRMLAMAIGIHASEKHNLKEAALMAEESGSTAETASDSERRDNIHPQGSGGDGHVLGGEPNVAAVEASLGDYFNHESPAADTKGPDASSPPPMEPQAAAESSSEREPLFALSMQGGEISYTETSRWDSGSARRPSTATSGESTRPAQPAAPGRSETGSRAEAAGPPGTTKRRPVHTRPSSAPVLGPQRKLLGIPSKHTPRERLITLSQRIETHKAELQVMLQGTGYGLCRELPQLPELNPEILQIKSDLARLQKEVLSAPVPDKLCDSLGGALMRMEPARRTALYNGVAALGFYSLQDFLYQAATAAECSARHRTWQKKGLQLSREVSSRKKPPPSTRTPGYTTPRPLTPDLTASGLS